MNIKVTDKYNDIIHLPHHQSKKRPHMPLIDRAAQFSPFAALTGYDDEVKEAARITNKKINLSDEMKRGLDEKLHEILERIQERPQVRVMYFIPDERKDGGRYITITGNIKRLDEYGHRLILTDRTQIFIEDILEIECMSGESFLPVIEKLEG